jgi:UDP-N-acetylglucosamine--N-acetylmuramyl-(pentapeptide) pyrophosphoryl-undecaprenol N-acetylglucosamine transferase
MLISDRELTADRLRDEVLRIIKDPDALSRMSAAGRGLVPADAAQRVAAIVLEVARR